MPEGPEVKVVTVELDKLLKDKKITCIYYNQSRFKDGFSSLNYPLTIQCLFCKGKKIFFSTFDSTGKRIYLLSSLMMNGRWVSCRTDEVNHNSSGLVVKKPPWRPQETNRSIDELSPHYQIVLEIGEISEHRIVDEYLCFHDNRPLEVGKFKILDQDKMNEKWNSLGPDLLSDEVSWESWRDVYRKHPRSMICTLLMNQHIFSGIGNYLKAEILYFSRLKPDRKVESLSDQELYNLYHWSVNKIKESYSYGGLTIYNFWSSEGKKGTFPVAVYDKKIDPYGNAVITDKKGGRTNHWVPGIQV